MHTCNQEFPDGDRLCRFRVHQRGRRCFPLARRPLTERCVSRYMKYLYPYECQKQGLSSPSELQTAIDGNKREGRRSTYSNSPYAELMHRSPMG